MMKKLLICALGLVLAACSGSGERSEKFDLGALKDSLQAEIMAVHDDVMPKHLELQRLKKQIDTKIEAIQNDSVLAGNMGMISELLDSAYHSMNRWMYEYEPMDSEMSREEILDYYKVERAKIDSVRTLMLESLNRAQEILKEEGQ